MRSHFLGHPINLHKTKEIVLHRPHPRRWSLPKSLEGIEQVQSLVDHVDYVFKICSQRVYLLKQLRDHGLPLQKLHTVFQAIVLSRLMYALLTFLIHAYLTQTAQVPKLLDGAKYCRKF